MKTLVIFDGDDTLWFVEPLYDEARRQAKAVVTAAGLDGAEWEKTQRALDVEFVAKYGLSAARFPASNIAAYRAVSERVGREVEDSTIRAIQSAASTVFERDAGLAPDAARVLGDLRQGDHELALLTRGDRRVQERRIEASGLGTYFSSIDVVPAKDKATFEMIAAKFDLPPARAWSIGNSLASDIYPALEAGMKAVWIDAHVWEYERRRVEEVAGHILRATALADIPVLIGAHAPQTT